MNNFLYEFGLLSIIILVFYIIWKVNEYFIFKKDRNKRYNLDEGNDK